MLLPTLTQVVHRTCRPCIYDHVPSNAPPFLLGGKKGASAVFGSHTIRSFCRWATANQKPVCVLFADVASAYYDSIRDLTARRIDEQGPAVQSQLMCHLMAASLTKGWRMPCAAQVPFRLVGAAPWLESLAAEFHRGSWFSFRSDHIPVATHRGSRPGSSLADPVAQIIATRDLLRAQSNGAGCTRQIPWDGKRDLSHPSDSSGTSALSDVIWADDLAECFMLSASYRAGHQVSLEASMLDEAFASQGYSLTYGPSKSAAHVRLLGVGSRAAKRDLFQGKGTLPVLRETEKPADLPLVNSYKHLGVVVGSTFLSCFAPGARRHGRPSAKAHFKPTAAVASLWRGAGRFCPQW